MLNITVHLQKFLETFFMHGPPFLLQEFISPLGVESGTAGKRSSFVIDTSSVGAGTLSITVDGPSKVDLACNEVNYLIIVSYLICMIT